MTMYCDSPFCLCCGCPSDLQNLKNDTNNCGACGRTCNFLTGNTCTEGKCECLGLLSCLVFLLSLVSVLYLNLYQGGTNIYVDSQCSTWASCVALFRVVWAIAQVLILHATSMTAPANSVESWPDTPWACVRLTCAL